ncbi:VOC family protein [uncultured Shimia sp.]|uniref:VOC family protein n=1 Tax=uncultured Shimia sp. TaxID=573152 RepID=UPI0026057AB0|nr:VOC family protein [uncultured Shimia sp.]
MQITGQITWVYTNDLEASVVFYRDVLGLPVWRDAGAAVIFEPLPGARIGVCTAFDGRVVEPKGSMITLLSEDVDGWYDRLIAAGARLKGPPETLEQFGIYSLFCEDPNGYLVEIQTFL